MCPNEMLLSAFVDGEVQTPWKERLEQHIAACPSCAKKTEALRSLSVSLRNVGGEAEAQALALAKQRIAASVNFNPPRKAPAAHGILQGLRQFWSRPVALPAPFLVLGLVALIFMAGISLGFFAPLFRPAETLAQGSVIKSLSPNALEAISRILPQSSDSIIIELPQSSVVKGQGTPIIMFSPAPALPEVTMTTYEGNSP